MTPWLIAGCLFSQLQVSLLAILNVIKCILLLLPKKEERQVIIQRVLGEGEWKSGYLILRYENKENLEILS